MFSHVSSVPNLKLCFASNHSFEKVRIAARVVVEGPRPTARSKRRRPRGWLIQERTALGGLSPRDLFFAVTLQIAPVGVLADREALFVQRLDDVHVPDTLSDLGFDRRHQAAKSARLRSRFKLLDGNFQIARHRALE